jgi:uncharacterized protein
MPGPSSDSPVRRWPERSVVERELRQWAAAQADARPALVRLGVFGSFARGGWGVGSDIDLVAVVAEDPRPFVGRASDWPLERLPVDADLLVYTAREFAGLMAADTRFGRVLRDETIWLVEKNPRKTDLPG